MWKCGNLLSASKDILPCLTSRVSSRRTPRNKLVWEGAGDSRRRRWRWRRQWRRGRRYSRRRGSPWSTYLSTFRTQFASDRFLSDIHLLRLMSGRTNKCPTRIGSSHLFVHGTSSSIRIPRETDRFDWRLDKRLRVIQN